MTKVHDLLKDCGRLQLHEELEGIETQEETHKETQESEGELSWSINKFVPKDVTVSLKSHQIRRNSHLLKKLLTNEVILFIICLRFWAITV